MTESYAEWMWVTVLAVWDFVNGNFITALAGALAGAFFGAWAAQKIAKRHRLSEQSLQELRNTNAAIALCRSALNQALTFKEKCTNEVKNEHERNFEEYKCFLSEQENHKRSSDEKFNKEILFSEMIEFNAPISSLRRIVYNRVPGDFKTYAVMSEIDVVYKMLKVAMKNNATVIKNFKNNNNIDSQLRLSIYFGIEYKGKTDLSFVDSLRQITEGIDDFIFLIYAFAKILHSVGKEIKKEIPDSRIEVVNVRKPEEAYNARLLPVKSVYEKWLEDMIAKEGLSS